MCGLVALVGDVPAAVARTAVIGAARRGPHSHGWAVDAGEWKIGRDYGPMMPADYPAGTAMRIGHCRLATCGSAPGDAPPLEESMPFAYAGAVLAHNGTVTDPEAHCGGRPCPVDSWAILYRAVDDGLEAAFDKASDGPHAALFAMHGQLFGIRVAVPGTPAHPLHAVRTDRWAAISSGRLPGGRLLDVGVTRLW